MMMTENSSFLVLIRNVSRTSAPYEPGEIFVEALEEMVHRVTGARVTDTAGLNCAPYNTARHGFLLPLLCSRPPRLSFDSHRTLSSLHRYEPSLSFVLGKNP